MILENERQTRLTRFMQGVNAVQAAVVKTEVSEPELSSNAMNVLFKTAVEIGIPQLALYEALGLHPAEGKAAVDELLARNMIKLHRLARKGRGGQPVVVEVLPKGQEVLESRGMAPGEKRIKRGGFLHDVYVRIVERWAHSCGFRNMWFERTLGDKAFDFVFEDKESDLNAIEICLSGSAEWTARQTLKGASVEGIKELHVACDRKEFLLSVMKAMEALDGLGLYRSKIKVRLLAEYMA